MSLGNVFNSYGEGGKLLYSGSDAKKYQATLGGGSGSGSFASLQRGQAGPVPGINGIEMPSWMSKNADDNIGELLKSYAGIGAAYDPTAQVQVRNDAIGYNTSAGGQAANNAATEYSNRAAQSGGSQQGAGVVKAQAMLPVLQQNAALRTDAADMAAEAHQKAAGLASQVAGTIGSLRSSYLSALTGYAEGQQRLQVQNNQFNAGFGLDMAKFNYGKQQDQSNLAEQQRQQQLMFASRQQAGPGRSTPYSVFGQGIGDETWRSAIRDSRGLVPANYSMRAANQLGGML